MDRSEVKLKMNTVATSLAFKLKTLMLRRGEDEIYQNLTDYAKSTKDHSYPELKRRYELYRADSESVNSYVRKLCDCLQDSARQDMRTLIRMCSDESKLLEKRGSKPNTVLLGLRTFWTNDLTPKEATVVRGGIYLKSMDATILIEVKNEFHHNGRALAGPLGTTMQQMVEMTPEPSEQELRLSQEDYGLNAVIKILGYIEAIKEYIRAAKGGPAKSGTRKRSSTATPSHTKTSTPSRTKTSTPSHDSSSPRRSRPAPKLKRASAKAGQVAS